MTGSVLLESVSHEPTHGSGCRDRVLVIGHDPGLDESASTDWWADVTRRVDAPDVDLVLVSEPLGLDHLRRLCALADARRCRVGLALAGDRALRPAPSQVTVAGVPVLLMPRHAHTTPRGLKRAVDVVAALVLAVVTAPVWLAIAVAVPLDSRGPALFVQERVGRDGRRFRVWKFRTMRADAPPYARSPGEADPNVTRLGRLLRPAGLDELPQLVNVLRGEMSLVGPRPEMPFIVDRYTALQRERLRATPGITGLWQLCGDRALAMHEQIEYDLYYVACGSLALDARLVVRTARRALDVLVRRAAGALHLRRPREARA